MRFFKSQCEHFEVLNVQKSIAMWENNHYDKHCKIQLYAIRKYQNKCKIFE